MGNDEDFETDGTDDLNAGLSMKTPKKRGTATFDEIMKAENKEKYLKLFDLLEIQIYNVEKRTATTDDVVNVFMALLDKVSLDDLDRAISLLFDQDNVHVIFITIANLTS